MKTENVKTKKKFNVNIANLIVSIMNAVISIWTCDFFAAAGWLCVAIWIKIVMIKERDNKLLKEQLEELNFEKVTRLEIINHKDENNCGREFMHWHDDSKIELSLQDDGKTLKIFIDKRLKP